MQFTNNLASFQIFCTDHDFHWLNQHLFDLITVLHHFTKLATRVSFDCWHEKRETQIQIDTLTQCEWHWLIVCKRRDLLTCRLLPWFTVSEILGRQILFTNQISSALQQFVLVYSSSLLPNTFWITPQALLLVAMKAPDSSIDCLVISCCTNCPYLVSDSTTYH